MTDKEKIDLIKDITSTYFGDVLHSVDYHSGMCMAFLLKAIANDSKFVINQHNEDDVKFHMLLRSLFDLDHMVFNHIHI